MEAVGRLNENDGEKSLSVVILETAMVPAFEFMIFLFTLFWIGFSWVMLIGIFFYF